MKLTKSGLSFISSSAAIIILAILFSSPWMYWLSLVALLISLIEGIELKINKKRIKNLKIKLDLPEFCHQNSVFTCNIYLLNNSKSIGYLQVIPVLPHGFDFYDKPVAFSGILKEGYHKIEMKLLPKQIGLHEFKEIKLILYDPLFLFFEEERIEIPNFISCYPSFETSRIRSMIRNLMFYLEVGSKAARKKGEGAEFYSIREYNYGDELKRIAWSHVAKSPERKLFVLEKEEEARNEYRLVIYLSPYIFEGFEGSSKFDALVVSLISFVNLVLKQNGIVNLLLIHYKEPIKLVIKRNENLALLINYLSSLKRLEKNENIKIFEMISNSFPLNSDITLITDIGIEDIDINDLIKIRDSFNLELFLLSNFNYKTMKDDILEILFKVEELKLNNIIEKYMLYGFNVKLIYLDQLLIELMKSYNKLRVYGVR